MKKMIFVTRNYSLFTHDGDNRPPNPEKHKGLKESMEKHGFLSDCPIIVQRKDGLLVVKDGQHRLHFARELGLPVAYTITDVMDLDIAALNDTQVAWIPKDFAETYSRRGITAYSVGLRFAHENRLPIGMAFALLAGKTSFSNCEKEFRSGKFTVTCPRFADAVIRIYHPLVKLAPALENNSFIRACMAVCRVTWFDRHRLIRCAERRRDELVCYATRDLYLEMLEKVYNYRQTPKSPLSLAAKEATRRRRKSAR